MAALKRTCTILIYLFACISGHEAKVHPQGSAKLNQLRMTREVRKAESDHLKSFPAVNQRYRTPAREHYLF